MRMGEMLCYCVANGDGSIDRPGEQEYNNNTAYLLKLGDHAQIATVCSK